MGRCCEKIHYDGHFMLKIVLIAAIAIIYLRHNNEVITAVSRSNLFTPVTCPINDLEMSATCYYACREGVAR